MRSLVMYVGHNHNMPLKMFKNSCSGSFSSLNEAEKSKWVFSVLYEFNKDTYRIIDHTLTEKLEIDLGSLKEPKEFFDLINKLKQDLNIEHTVLCLDANLGIPANPVMTMKTIECINQLDAAYLTLFSGTPACLSDVEFWADYTARGHKFKF